MKKLVSSVLAASMVLSLAACGSSASTDTASSSEAASTSTAATTEAAGEGSGAYTGTPIKIGGIGPITGGAAIYGQAVKNAEEKMLKPHSRKENAYSFSACSVSSIRPAS